MSSIQKIKGDVGEVEVVDIPTMHQMLDNQYRDFIRKDGLMFIDHHDVLRSSIAEYPIATTGEQLGILMEELRRLRDKMVQRSGAK